MVNDFTKTPRSVYYEEDITHLDNATVNSEVNQSFVNVFNMPRLQTTKTQINPLSTSSPAPNGHTYTVSNGADLVHTYY